MACASNNWKQGEKIKNLDRRHHVCEMSILWYQLRTQQIAKFEGQWIEVKSPTSSGQDRVTCIGAMLVTSCQVKQFWRHRNGRVHWRGVWNPVALSIPCIINRNREILCNQKFIILIDQIFSYPPNLLGVQIPFEGFKPTPNSPGNPKPGCGELNDIIRHAQHLEHHCAVCMC